jgi:hypothetical protein
MTSEDRKTIIEWLKTFGLLTAVPAVVVLYIINSIAGDRVKALNSKVDDLIGTVAVSEASAKEVQEKLKKQEELLEAAAPQKLESIRAIFETISKNPDVAGLLADMAGQRHEIDNLKRALGEGAIGILEEIVDKGTPDDHQFTAASDGFVFVSSGGNGSVSGVVVSVDGVAVAQFGGKELRYATLICPVRRGATVRVAVERDKTVKNASPTDSGVKFLPIKFKL